jgi:hypothetical protein
LWLVCGMTTPPFGPIIELTINFRFGGTLCCSDRPGMGSSGRFQPFVGS